MKHKKSCTLPASLSSSSSPARSSTSSLSDPESSARQTSSPSGEASFRSPEPAPPEGAFSSGSSGPHPPFARGNGARALDRFLSIKPLPFVELLARSNFSFLQGASHPEEMVFQAKQLGYSGLAIVDTNGLYGVVRGYQAAEKPSAFDTMLLSETPGLPFKYLFGTELTPHDASPIALLPMNKTGYSRICRLITLAKRPAPKGYSWLSLEEILKDNDDLIAFPLPPWKENDLKRLREAFQDRLYLPVYKDYTWESVQLYQQALALEAKFAIPIFATQRPLYHVTDRKPLHDVLTCILHKNTIFEARTKLSLNRERYLRPPAWLTHLWRERPDAIGRTLEIAARLKFSLSEVRYRYPQEVLPPGKTASEYLRELVEEGLRWRFPEGTPEKGRRLVEYELTLIIDLEYEDYFLTLWDICKFATRQGILHQGRGSAANSIVCFCLGLTNIDPTKLDLLFERFISKERGEPPDIDIDFEHERREEVIQYIYKKYGSEHAAMVCTTICYRSRMAIREVAKVMGVALPQIDALIKFMGREGLSRLTSEPVEVAKFGLSMERFRLILKLALEMQGFPRHLGIHTGGFVIGHDPIVDFVPVEKATMDNRYVVQWNKDDVNTLGLMKVDVLGLGMLTALRKCLTLLKDHKSIDWNLAQIPHDDKPTYAMIQKADTIGVFQIESRAQMSLLPRLKPANYYDLVIEVAIVRPGPIQGGMVHPFLRRRAGLEKTVYAHPSLKPILEKTMGVPIFQEQIMQIAVVAAGFTPGEADELRRIMSSAWTKGSTMHTLRQRLISGMLSNGISLRYAEQIYKTIEGFSSYGFPESHAASFALLTYASCYLKHHHPEVFACSLLNSQPMGFYSPRQLIADAQRHRVSFFALDVQISRYDYTLEPVPANASANTNIALGVRVGFRAVYGLSRAHVDKLVEERDRGGPFHDLNDLARRTRLPRAALLRLAAAGSLKSFGHEAREALWLIQSLTLDPESLLFGSPLSGSEASASALPAPRNDSFDEIHGNSELERTSIPRETPWQEVQREYHSKGFALETHPLAILRPYLRLHKPSYFTAKQTETIRHGTRLRMAGLLSLLQKPPTAKGMCFLSLEDETGIFNVIVVPQLYQKFRMTLMSHTLLEIDGHLENRKGVRHLRAQDIRPLHFDSPTTLGGRIDPNRHAPSI